MLVLTFLFRYNKNTTLFLIVLILYFISISKLKLYRYWKILFLLYCLKKKISGDRNTSGNLSNINHQRRSPTQDFFENVVLEKSPGIDEMGSVKWDLFGCFCLAWLVCYLCIFKGTKSVGKVAYVTVILPYVLLVTLLIASCQLEGATNGVMYFLKPEWGKILSMDIWVKAAAQNFMSIGIAFGAMIAFSSYNDLKGHLLQDTLTIAGVNAMTSLVSGLVIFSAMGHMAHQFHTSVEKVVKEGPELVFIVYPQIFKNLPAPYLWSALFFLTLIMLGVDSQFAYVEVVITTLADSNGGRFMKRFFGGSKQLLSLFVCAVAFLAGLPNLFNGGIYFFNLLDNYDTIIALLVIAFFEIVALCWLYGAKSISRDIKNVSGKSTSRYFTYSWLFGSPLVMGVILVSKVVTFKPPTYGKYEYPGWAHSLGWLITASSLVCIPLFALVEVLKCEGSLLQRLNSSISPRKVVSIGEVGAKHSPEEKFSDEKVESLL